MDLLCSGKGHGVGFVTSRPGKFEAKAVEENEAIFVSSIRAGECRS